MELGDKVAKVTGALGIKKCEGCKKRQAELNVLSEQFSRRGFVAGLTATALFIKNKAVWAAWDITQSGAPPMEHAQALGLIRTINISALHFHHENGEYPNQVDLLTTVIAHKDKVIDPNDPNLAYFRAMTPNGSQIIPGWTLDHVQLNGGYRTILAGPDWVYISSHTGVIYQVASRPSVMPKAIELIVGAEDFPNSYPLGGIPPLSYVPPTLWERIKTFWSPVYAQGCHTCTFACCESNCPYCFAASCGNCDFNNCSNVGVWNCSCVGNPGMLGCCVWYTTYCNLGGKNACNNCCQKMFNSPCCCTPCTDCG